MERRELVRGTHSLEMGEARSGQDSKIKQAYDWKEHLLAGEGRGWN
jgi:hypothetical protein